MPIELNIIAQPPGASGNYNCFVFAFGLEQDREFLGGQNPIQQEFVKYLFERGILKVKASPESGDLIFYKDSEGNITHAGILKSETMMVSKWMWGAIIESCIWDVPSSFGDEIFFCSAPDPVLIKREYLAYRDCGIEIKPIG